MNTKLQQQHTHNKPQIDIAILRYTDANEKSERKHEENLDAAIFMRFALKQSSPY